MEEIKYVVLGKVEFEFRERLKLKRFLWSFWATKILMQGRKSMICQLNDRLKLLDFILRS